VHWNETNRRIEKVIARGDVRLNTREGTATSGLAILDVSRGIIEMRESPRLSREGESVEGYRIVYSIDERRSTVLSGKGKRVKTQLIPKGQK
jgi:lipopolysaccharide export system protein LptA